MRWKVWSHRWFHRPISFTNYDRRNQRSWWHQCIVRFLPIHFIQKQTIKYLLINFGAIWWDAAAKTGWGRHKRSNGKKSRQSHRTTSKSTSICWEKSHRLLQNAFHFSLPSCWQHPIERIFWNRGIQWWRSLYALLHLRRTVATQSFMRSQPGTISGRRRCHILRCLTPYKSRRAAIHLLFWWRTVREHKRTQKVLERDVELHMQMPKMPKMS